MSQAPRAGPVALCTVIAQNGEAAANAYARWLHQHIIAAGEMDEDTGKSIGHPHLSGNRHWLLANKVGRQWLHILEAPEAAERDALRTFGWLAMEVLVEDVDGLALSLAGSPFELLRPPADLDVSD